MQKRIGRYIAAGLGAGIMFGNAFAGVAAIANLQEPVKAKGSKTGKPVSVTFGGVNNQEFMIDGKPFQIRGAEIHPQRIPREYWKHRIQAAKAMGLNTIAFYVMWNDLERPDGTFDVKTGNRDIAAFLKLCQEEGMWVLFRPGPYVCAEWDFGGLPHYLLKDPKAKLRTTQDETFMKAQTRYLEEMAKIAEPFLAKNGGPILMTQLENEYGSYQRKDRAYMEWLRDFWTKKGFGPFYTSDGAGEHYLKDVVLPGVAVGLDPGKTEEHWKIANKMNPGVPVFSSESYPGWLRHWGEGNWEPTPSIVDDVKWYMDQGKSFSLFVFHGGTNFGMTAGANNGGHGKYQPDLTSYDYGSPVDEQGRKTEFYGKMRDIILAKLPQEAKVPEPPADIPAMEIPSFTPVFRASLWDLKSAKPVAESPDNPPYFETWNQNQGMAIYQASLPAGEPAKLTFENVNDYAQVYLDGKLIKTLDRRLGEKSLDIPARKDPAKLDVVVEAMGHINFHIDMEADRKGIFGTVKLGETPVKGWKVYAMPLNYRSIAAAKSSGDHKNRAGALFRHTLKLDNPQDTFLDMSKYTKGYVWVNGVNVGRYWNVGPQLRLYVPAPFLKKGNNVIEILDLAETTPKAVRGMTERNKEKGTIKTENTSNQWD